MNENNIFLKTTECRQKRLCAKLCLLFFSFLVVNANAQQAVVTLDRNQILLGEQIILQLKLDNVINETQSVSAWFNVPDTGNHIEVIRRDKIDTVEIEGRTTYTQKIIITSFDSGTWIIPVTPPVVKSSDSIAAAINCNTASLQVMPVDVSRLKDFHPVKDIIRVTYTDYTWLYIAIGILVSALIIYLIIRRLKRRKRAPVKEKPLIKGPPMEWALQQIALLEKENLIEKGEGKLFFTRLDDICRTYFDERTHTHTLQSTSIEMMEKLRAYLIREKDRTALRQFSQLSDVVKFAEYQPQEQQGKDAINTAKETIMNIEKEVLDRQEKNAH